ncbi:MAG: hypothetical protein AAF234_06590 [Pseudomonadota bacterium]
MQYDLMPDDAERIAEARNSFSGNLLTDRQFDDFMAATGMMRRRIEEAGSFIEPLNDLANAIARNERYITPAKADTIIRDLFKIRNNGVTMNALLEGLLDREEALLGRENNPAEAELQKAYQSAKAAGLRVQNGTKITFHRALSEEAASLASDLGITHFGAKSLMAESFENTEGRTLSEWGKELDEKHYRPQIDALKKQRSSSRSRRRTHRPSYG